MADTNKYEPHSVLGGTFGLNSSLSSVSDAKLLDTDKKGTLCFTGDGNIVLDGAVYGVYLITGSDDVAVKALNPDNVDLKSMWLTTDGHIWAVVKDATTGTKTIQQFSIGKTELTNLQSSIESAINDIGDTGSLDTSNRQDLVSAINEVLNKVTSEATARESADATLQSNIDALSETVEEDAEVKAKALTDLDSRETVVENKTSGIVYCNGIINYGATPAVTDIGTTYLYYKKVQGTAVLNGTIIRNSQTASDVTYCTCTKGIIYNVAGTLYVFDGTACNEIGSDNTQIETILSNIGDLGDIEYFQDNSSVVAALNEAASCVQTNAESLKEHDERISNVEDKTSGIVYCDGMTLLPPVSPYTAGRVELGSSDHKKYDKVRTYTTSEDYSEVSCVTGKIYNVNGDNYVFDGNTCVKIQGGGKTLTIKGASDDTTQTFDGTSGVIVDTTSFTAKKVANALKFGDKTYDGSSEQTITAKDLGLDSAFRMISNCDYEQKITPSKYYPSDTKPESKNEGFICIGEDLYYSDEDLTKLVGTEWAVGKDYISFGEVPSTGTYYGIVTYKKSEDEDLWDIQGIYTIKDGTVSSGSPSAGDVYTDNEHREWYYANGCWALYGDEGSYALKADTYSKSEVDEKLINDAYYNDEVVSLGRYDDNIGFYGIVDIEAATEEKPGVMSSTDKIFIDLFSHLEGEFNNGSFSDSPEDNKIVWSAGAERGETTQYNALNFSIPYVTTDTAGVMSAQDKANLDNCVSACVKLGEQLKWQ